MVEVWIPALGLVSTLFFFRASRSRILGLALLGYVAPYLTIDTPLDHVLDEVSPRLSDLVADCAVVGSSILLTEYWMRPSGQTRLAPRSVPAIGGMIAIPLMCAFFAAVPRDSRPASFAEHSASSPLMCTYTVAFILAVTLLGAKLTFKGLRDAHRRARRFSRILAMSIRVGGASLMVYAVSRAIKAAAGGAGFTPELTMLISTVALTGVLASLCTVAVARGVDLRRRVFRIHASLRDEPCRLRRTRLGRLASLVRLMVFPRAYMVDRLLALADDLATTREVAPDETHLDHFDIVKATTELLSWSAAPPAGEPPPTRGPAGAKPRGTRDN